MPAARRRRLWPGTVPGHVGNACGSARNHLGDSRVSPTESAQTAGKSTEYVFPWHYAFADFPGPNQSFQRFAPDAPVASVEDQSDSWSEGFAGSRNVSGQTLRLVFATSWRTLCYYYVAADATARCIRGASLEQRRISGDYGALCLTPKTRIRSSLSSRI